MDKNLYFSHEGLYLEQVGVEKSDLVQEIYFNSPTYFRRVDGTEPLEGMALKDIQDVPAKRGDHYTKIAALIYDGSKAIGYADLHVNHRSKGMAYLGLLILREDVQGKGLGRSSYNLVERFLSDCLDIEKIYLGVSNHNQVQEYWEKMGFTPNGDTYVWKGEKIESLVTEMEKKLIQPVLRLERNPENKLNFQIRGAEPFEAKYLSDLSARSKAYWPYDKEYLKQTAQVTHVTENDILSWHFRVAVYDGIILGFSGMAPVKNEYMLDHLWIEPDYIGKEIGHVLFEDAVLNAKKMGWTRFTIAADPYAERFYLKQGAKRIGERESKIKPGFFLPLLEVNVGLTLIGDKKVKDIPVQDCGEPIVDLSKSFPQLHFDWDRLYVQKNSSSISLGETRLEKSLFRPRIFYLKVIDF
ncbi:MAG: GNAT family N-acetyltransferase [Bdellovibrionaceae bacterium]|nr:GNAT family N-acetyltransferase [Pseudobdellovibrionaceae bacterium]